MVYYNISNCSSETCRGTSPYILAIYNFPDSINFKFFSLSRWLAQATMETSLLFDMEKIMGVLLSFAMLYTFLAPRIMSIIITCYNNYYGMDVI